jgi:hypothetical protein
MASNVEQVMEARRGLPGVRFVLQERGDLGELASRQRAIEPARSHGPVSLRGALTRGAGRA